MSARTIGLDDRLYDYLVRVSLREPEVLRRLRLETARLPERNMQISPEQGQFMALLARLMNARHVLEIGTFTGYSALAIALALPDDGHITACDISATWTALGRETWAAAGVIDRIDLRIAPALETLDALVKEGYSGRYDLAFIDADKANYTSYYEQCLVLVRTGGLIVVDNVLWGGSVADPQVNDANTQAIRAFNEMLMDDGRIDLSLVPIGDGLTLARKRDEAAPVVR